MAGKLKKKIKEIKKKRDENKEARKEARRKRFKKAVGKAKAFWDKNGEQIIKVSKKIYKVVKEIKGDKKK